MKKLVTLILFVAGTATAADIPCDGNFAQKLASEHIEFNLPSISKVDVAPLWFRTNEGVSMPTSELYVTQYNHHGYPKVIDRVVGHNEELSKVDLNADGNPELILKFKSGGNQTLINIYQLEKHDLIKLDSNAIASNMDSIEIIQEVNRPPYIKFSNVEFDSMNNQKIVTSMYYLNGNKLIPMGE
ncbi:hypothetical protein [Shewanella colwelliana]|uniref:hypothetical protein n=1 Tax=Shewanella colwelliana TaxID=23 RepID=UPI00299D2EB3|nr:hypothetical protein [Shewanella colwelliana]MDX1282513.1 hypothetical protein [Shewanella colwelliana]